MYCSVNKDEVQPKSCGHENAMKNLIISAEIFFAIKTNEMQCQNLVQEESSGHTVQGDKTEWSKTCRVTNFGVIIQGPVRGRNKPLLGHFKPI